MGRLEGARVVNRLGRARPKLEASHSAVRALSVSAYNRGCMWHVSAPIGPVSAIERAIVCMRMPGFSGLASADFEGVFAHSYKPWRPRLFFTRAAQACGETLTANAAILPWSPRSTSPALAASSPTTPSRIACASGQLATSGWRVSRIASAPTWIGYAKPSPHASRFQPMTIGRSWMPLIGTSLKTAISGLLNGTKSKLPAPRRTFGSAKSDLLNSGSRLLLGSSTCAQPARSTMRLKRRSN